MKNITIAFLAAMSLMSFGGCKKKGGADAIAKLGEFKDAMCKCTDKACAEKVSGELTKWSQEHKEKPKMSEAEDKAATETALKMADCQQKAMGTGGTEPATGSAGSAEPAAGSAAGSAAAPTEGSAAPAPAAAGGGDLPAECADYKAAIEKLASCDKLPQATRDALKQSYDQTSAAWASVPAEGKAALGTACKAAADAVKQSAAACN